MRMDATKLEYLFSLDVWLKKALGVYKVCRFNHKLLAILVHLH